MLTIAENLSTELYSMATNKRLFVLRLAESWLCGAARLSLRHFGAFTGHAPRQLPAPTNAPASAVWPALLAFSQNCVNPAHTGFDNDSRVRFAQLLQSWPSLSSRLSRQGSVENSRVLVASMITAASQVQNSKQHLASLSKLLVQAHGILSESSYHPCTLPAAESLPLATTLLSTVAAALQRATCAHGTQEIAEVDSETAERIKALVTAATGTAQLLLLRSTGEQEGGPAPRPDLPLAAALLERLLWLHGTAIVAARAVGRVDWAWALCERADTGSASLSRAVELCGVGEQLQQAREADRQSLDAMEGEGSSLAKRLAAIHHAMDLLLPLQHSLHWDDPTVLQRWLSPSFLPAATPWDISTAPFLPVQRPKVPLSQVLAALTSMASRQEATSVTSFLSATPLPRWRSYIGYVEGKVVSQMRAQAKAHARAEEEQAQAGVMDVGASSTTTAMLGAVLRRRKAASLLSLYREADAAALACELAEAKGKLAGKEGAELLWAPSHFIPLGPIGRLLRHTLRCVGPLHAPEAILPFWRDRARLLLRMAAMGAEQLPTAYLNRPDVALVCSVTREAAAMACYVDSNAQYRSRVWPLTRGSAEEDERAVRQVLAAIAASKPADKLVVKLCAGLMMHMRGPTPGSYAARAGAESPRPWQLEAMRLAGRLGVPTGNQAPLSHTLLARLSVPQAALVDYLLHRTLDSLQCWVLLSLCARLQGEPFALLTEEGLGLGGRHTSPAGVAAERLSSLLALYDQVCSCHALPHALVHAIRDTCLKWAALLTACEGGVGDSGEGLSLSHRMAKLSQRTGEHEELAATLPSEDEGPGEREGED